MDDKVKRQIVLGVCIALVVFSSYGVGVVREHNRMLDLYTDLAYDYIDVQESYNALLSSSCANATVSGNYYYCDVDEWGVCR